MVSNFTSLLANHVPTKDPAAVHISCRFTPWFQGKFEVRFEAICEIAAPAVALVRLPRVLPNPSDRTSSAVKYEETAPTPALLMSDKNESVALLVAFKAEVLPSSDSITSPIFLPTVPRT